ncbi:MAG: Co2+/Mg2+ efflux protein ApaG [Gammaproteobacteria bacterium]|jgi:ApaG protein
MQTDQEIMIHVETAYIEAQSAPDEDQYAFSYTITIHNTGSEAAKLLNRHWIITDANGKVEEVRGEGVVGEQPYLKPGEAFRYTSGAMLDTPVGSMEGEYEMVADNGRHFLAAIPPFSLAVPNKLH